MLFSSYEFIFFFLPITVLVYFFLNHRRLVVAGKCWLVLASLFFYGWWDVAYLPLIVISMLFNFAVGSGLARQGDLRVGFSKKSILTFGIALNLALLGYFKYVDFFIENLNWVLDEDLTLPKVVLPLAISFFTFTQITYLVDSYRGKTGEYDFLNYALFVTFFPHLIAGPIVHHYQLMPQFASRWNMLRRYRNICLGLFIFSVGFFKKIVLADTFAGWATPGFDEKATLDFTEAWVTSLSYTFQLYFDFSGYTDMAIGASLLFNIRLPINFNSPYKALSIQDFWRRWHITLSNFLRDYLYIPLGGNRNGAALTYLNLFTTFLLGGLWHGASWMFVIWGALHGGALVIHRAWQQFGLRMPALLGWFLTFNFVNFAWVFFRAKDIESAVKVLEGMFLFDSGALVKAAASLKAYKFDSVASLLIPGSAAGQLTVYLWLLGAFALVLLFRNTSQYTVPVRGVAIIQPLAFSFLAAFALIASLFSTYSEFIYFNF